MVSLNMSSVVWFIMRISDEVSPSNCTRKTFIFIIFYVISFSYDYLALCCREIQIVSVLVF